MRRAERQVKQSAGVMSRAVKGVNTSLAGLGSIAGVTLGGAGLLAGAGAFLKVADAAKSLSAQLKLATAEYGSFAKANQDVRNIAEQTRSDLLATAELYAALQRNSGQLGTTQEQVARATQTVAEAFKISGAATSEQSAATRQLIQAFQSGVLRGDEFNSVMENAPRLAKLLADSIGVTVGELRAMAKEGQLTSDKLVKAFTDKKFTEGLDAEFKQLPVTFDEAMGQVYNAAIIVFSAFDRGGQFSNSIANFVSDGTEGFKQLEERAFTFGQQVGDLVTAIEVVRDALGSLQSDGVLGFASLAEATYTWRDALGDTLEGIDAIANALYNLSVAPSRGLGGLFGKGSIGEVFGFGPLATNPVDLAGEFRRRTDEQRLRQRFSAAREASRDAANASRVPPPFRAPAGKGKKPRKGRAPPRDRSEDVEFQFAQELRQAQADILRAQQSMAVTNEERARIALLLLDAEREGKEAELNDRVRRAERDFAEGKITADTLEQVKVQADKLRAEYDSLDALERQAIADDLRAQKAQDAAALVDADYDLQLEKLQLESALKETAAERRDAELRILDVMKQQEKARLEAVIADQQSSELAKEEARRRLAQLDAIYAGRADVVTQNTRSPMEDYLASLPTTAAKAQEALEQLQVQGFEGLIDAAVALTEGFDNAKDALLNTLKQFLQGLLRMQLQRQLGSLLGGGGFNFGSLFGGAGGTNAGGISVTGLPTTLPGYAHGGSMMLRGIPGIDKNVISMNGIPIARANFGERLTFEPANDRGGGRVVNQNFNVYANDADSFRRNERQIARESRRRLGV